MFKGGENITLSIYKQKKILDLTDNDGLSIRKIAKQLKISKDTVVKYLQLFKQGYDPYKVNIKFKKKKKSKSYNRQISEKNYCYENYVKPLEQQNKKLAMDNMILKEERDQYKNQLNVKKEEIERYIRVDMEKNNRLLSLENEIEEIKDEQKNNINQLKVKEENIGYKQVDIEKDNKVIPLDENLEIKEGRHLYKNLQIQTKDENKTLKMENTRLKEKEGEYLEQLKDKNIEINSLKQQIQNMNDESKCKDFLRKIEESNKQHNLMNQKIKRVETILNQPIDINELRALIGEIAYKEFKKESQSKLNDTMQKETYGIKSQEDQNFEKINNSNLEVNKSIDIQSKTEIVYLYIFVKSFIEIYKKFQANQKNINQIIVID